MRAAASRADSVFTTRPLVCEALARRLHCPITPADAGLGAADLPPGPTDPSWLGLGTDIVARLVELFGGRAVRPLAAAFMVNTIAPYLRAQAREDIGVRMLSAAADHCYLTGYRAADDGIEGLAQHYYLQAIELAGHAGDHLTYCTTLRGMSVHTLDSAA